MRRALITTLSLVSSLVAAGRPADAAPPSSLNGSGAAIVGGQPSEICAWPSVVALEAGGLCTGTLVHPRVVTYAAHCGTFHTKVMFGESSDAPAREVDTLICERNSELFAVSSMDFAYCLLAEPVDDVPITPPLWGCDEALIEVGTPVTIVGFGDTTSEPPEQVGIKHEAQTQITGLLTTVFIGGMGVGADAGDSGGPAFVALDDGSWRMLGLVSGGGGDGATVQYVPAPVLVAWVEDRSGVDITPCHDGEGNWAPTPACEGFYVASEPGAAWAQGCASVVSGPSERCGPPWTAIDDLDGPSVAFVEPQDGAQLPGAPVHFDVLAEADDGEGSGVAELRLRVDGVAWIDALGQVAVDEVPPYRFADLSLESDGEHLLELEARDQLGNSASVSAMVIVGEPDTTETGTGEGGDETETGSDTGPPADDDSGGTCQCASGPRPPLGLALLLVVGVLALPRRPSEEAVAPTRP